LNARPQRSRDAVLFAAIATSAFGCTFLVTFDDLPKDQAEFTTPDARPRDGASSGTTSSSGGSDATQPEDDAASGGDANTSSSDPCSGKLDSKYCNGTDIVVDGGGANDLVTCLGGKKVGSTTCTSSCKQMPAGSPDECDQCGTKANGNYCGDDFFGWHPANANTRVQCTGGAIAETVVCTTCMGAGPNATCP
jgi:hypothetical protein